MDPTEGMVEDQAFGVHGGGPDGFSSAAEAFSDDRGDFAGDRADLLDDRGDFAGDPDEVDEPYEVPEPPVTGDPVVDDSVRRVAGAAVQSLDVQVGVYDGVHRALQDRLADVED